jgi:uncharacterized delta-60 repeat protein
MPDLVAAQLASVHFDQMLLPGEALPVRITSAVIPQNTEPTAYYLSVVVRPDAGAPAAGPPADGVFVSAKPDVVVTTAPSATPPAGPGDLDPTFGDNGIVRQQTGLLTTAAVATQPDGKTIAVGQAAGAGQHDFGVVRFNTDGSLDTTFGSGGLGLVSTDFSGDDDTPAAVQVQSDGKILVAGTTTAPGNASNSDFAIARYNADGSPDTTFGTGGVVVTDFTAGVVAGPSADVARGLLLLPDGQFVVSGRSDAGGTGTDFALARYTPTGALDTTFNTTGQVLTDFAGGDDAANAVAIDPSTGRLIAAGSAGANSTNTTTTFALARYNTDGTLDSTFGTGGKVTTAIGSQDDEAFAVGVGAKGLIVAAGATTAGGGSTSDFAAVRYTAKGTPDRLFGNGGIATAHFDEPAAANQVLLGTDGSVLLAGAATPSLASVDPAHLDVALAQLTNRGVLDPAFGTNGQTLLKLGTSGASSSSLRASASLRAQQSAAAQALGVLSQQKAIAQALNGRLIAVATNGTDTVEAAIVGSGADLSPAVTTTLPASVVGGRKGAAVVTVTDTGTQPASGPVAITLLASLDPNADGADTQLVTLNKSIKLRPGKSRKFRTKFAVPQNLVDGNYFIVAKVEPGTGITDVGPLNDVSATAAPVMVAAPFTDLTGQGPAGPSGLTPGAAATIPVIVTNQGNVPAKGTIALQLLAGASATPSASDTTLANATNLKVNLKPAASKTFKVKAQVPSTLPAGTYTLLAVISSTLTPPESDLTNNVLVGPMPLVIG